MLMSDEPRNFNPLKLTPKQFKRLDPIAQIQTEVQREQCPTCDRFDKKKNDFKEKGHPYNPQNCKYHWTDITGECTGYEGPLTEVIEGPTIDEVYGSRVRLREEYHKDNELIAAMKAGLVKGFTASMEVPIRTSIPKGSEGTIQEGPYSGGIFDYKREWPVQFDMFKDGEVAGFDENFTIGVPHELLEFLDKKKRRTG
jgi:hypothetical protein